jgi:hypothetical protein
MQQPHGFTGGQLHFTINLDINYPTGEADDATH